MFKYCLFCAGLAVLGAAYLYFLEVWRLGCLILLPVGLLYVCGAVAVMEK